MLYVGRNAERRWNVRLVASVATCSNGTNGLHSTTAWPTSSIPRRPARPVSWVYSPGVSISWWSPVNLRQLLDHDRARRHVDADGERLGGEHHLHQALDEARLDDLLERRHHPGVVGGDAGLELGEELAVAEHGEVRVGSMPAEPGVDDLADAVALGSPSSAAARRRGTLRAASSHWLRLKMKQIAGSSPRCSSRSIISSRDRACTARRRPLPLAPGARRGRLRPPHALRRRAAAPRGSAARRSNVGSRCSRSFVRSPTR